MAQEQATHSPQTRYPSVFWLLLGLTIALRLLGITRPLLGAFATKNVVYAMIARNWASGRAGIWYPTLDVLRDGQRAWHMTEFPASAYLSGGLWSVAGGSLDIFGRATALAFSLLSVWLIFDFVSRRFGRQAALGAAAALALSPISIIYGQSFMLEASLVCFTLATFCLLDRWLEHGHTGWLVAAGVSLALLLLTKIYMVVILLPLAALVWQSPRRRSGIAWERLALVTILALMPAAAWYAHAWRTADPDGPFAARIFFSVRQSAADHARPWDVLLSGQFARQMFDDLVGVVLTPLGFAFALAGLLDRRWRKNLPWLLAVALLVLILPRKFLEMNYYWMAVLPPLCILVGLGWQITVERLALSRRAIALVVVVAFVLSLRYAVGPAFVTPEEDRPVLAAAQTVAGLADAGEPVATIHGSTLDLLYYCNRPGWALDANSPTLADELRECRRLGARFVVVVGPTNVELGEPVRRGQGFAVYQLSANER